MLENATQRIYLSNLALDNLREKVANLSNTAAALKANATHLQESNVEGKPLRFFCLFKEKRLQIY